MNSITFNQVKAMMVNKYAFNQSTQDYIAKDTDSATFLLSNETVDDQGIARVKLTLLKWLGSPVQTARASKMLGTFFLDKFETIEEFCEFINKKMK